MSTPRRPARSRTRAHRKPHPAIPLDFEPLYRRYFGDVFRFIARRVRDQELARDLTQETFIRAFRARAAYDTARPAWPWLQRIARNVLINAVRDERRRHPSICSDVSQLAALPDRDASANPDQSVVNKTLRDDIAAALARLTPDARRILHLRADVGHSYEEIASIEGVTTDSVRALLKRARRDFRVAFSTLTRDVPAVGFLHLLRRCAFRMRLFASDLGPMVAALGSSEVIASGVVVVTVVGSVFVIRGGGSLGPPGSRPIDRRAGIASSIVQVHVVKRASSSHAHHVAARSSDPNEGPTGVAVTTDPPDRSHDRVIVRTHRPSPRKRHGSGTETGIDLPCAEAPPLCDAFGTAPDVPGATTSSTL